MRTKAVVVAASLMIAAAGMYASAPMRAWAIGSGAHSVPPETFARPLSAAEMRKVESYMRQVFGSKDIRLVHVPPEAEVWLGDHFLGIVFPDDRKDGRTFYFEMAIFEEEIEESPPVKRGR